MPRRDIGETRRASLAIGRAKRVDAQEISGRIGRVANPRRRKRASASFRRFCETYFAARFCKAWSADHLRIIDRMELAAQHGGQIAIAMPRGSGKTTLVEALVVFAVLTGLREFVCLIGATGGASIEMLDSIKTELETNELLLADFPREAGPFAALEGEARRCNGQRFKGKRTHIQWKMDRLTFASIPGSKASGAVIRVAGITGRVRGMQHTRPDGSKIRPSFVVLDDPQTDESAMSQQQTAMRERIISSAVLALAGPGVKITAVMLCTVIAKRDLADKALDRTLHPEWQGERTKMLYQFPANMEAWNEYKRIWAEDKAAGGDGSVVTEYYRENREAMDAGAQVAWAERYEPDQLSAVQNAMHWFLTNRSGFLANAQNEPEEDSALISGRVDPRSVAERWNGRPAGEIPLRTEHLTAHIDVHDELLYYAVAAFEPGFSGVIVDYGTSPKQPEPYFALSNVHRPLSAVYPNRGKEGTIYAGLEELLLRILTQSYRRDDGQTMAVGLALVDAGYVPDVVAKVVRALNRGPQLMPAKGFGISASRKPYNQYKPEAGVRAGQHWRIMPAPGTRLPTANIDTNWWKSHWRDRLRTPVGDPGAVTLFGQRADQHRLWADHCGSEYPVETIGPWGKVEEWKTEPNRDNHWWDCGVGCCVAASILGVTMPEWAENTPRKRRVVSLGELVGTRR